jgi:hypothetical protein
MITSVLLVSTAVERQKYQTNTMIIAWKELTAKGAPLKR